MTEREREMEKERKRGRERERDLGQLGIPSVVACKTRQDRTGLDSKG